MPKCEEPGGDMERTCKLHIEKPLGKLQGTGGLPNKGKVLNQCRSELQVGPDNNTDWQPAERCKASRHLWIILRDYYVSQCHGGAQEQDR